MSMTTERAMEILDPEHREQGCGLCRGVITMSGTFDATGLVGNRLLTVNGDGDFAYCPMCGRKLSERRCRP